MNEQTIGIQINGKTQGTVCAPTTFTKEEMIEAVRSVNPRIDTMMATEAEFVVVRFRRGRMICFTIAD